jgi:potassium inwardly-rectifying channel subfamily J
VLKTIDELHSTKILFQHTIGYGSRQTTNECVSAMVTMSFQSIVGCFIQAFMVGLVFAKLSRPKQRFVRVRARSRLNTRTAG